MEDNDSKGALSMDDSIKKAEAACALREATSAASSTTAFAIGRSNLDQAGGDSDEGGSSASGRSSANSSTSDMESSSRPIPNVRYRRSSLTGQLTVAI